MKGKFKGWSSFVGFAGGLLLLATNALAASQDFSACETRFPGDDPQARESRYQCFAAIGKQATYSGYQLDRLWPSYQENPGIVAYKQSYLLITHTDLPNYAPTSPNAKNQVTPTYRYEQQEAKFQFSLKSQYPHPDWIGENNSLWFGYTQQSHWQVMNGANSRPFRETNFAPEPLIFSHRFAAPQAGDGWAPRFLNLGFVHQSNGQALPYSRSWNRIYVQLGIEKRLNESGNFAITVRPWIRYAEDPLKDDNPDIQDYLGHGDLELMYWNGKHFVSALLRSRSLQVDYSWSPGGDNTLHWHMQLFSGYGESLLDYNQQHSVIGGGVSLPYD